MKRVLVLAVVMMLAVGVSLVYADTVVETSGRSIDGYADTHHTHRVLMPNVDDQEGIEMAVQLDVPDLVKINKDVSIGVEVEKDCVQTNMKEGWKAVAKVTVKWSLIDLTKK